MRGAVLIAAVACRGADAQPSPAPTPALIEVAVPPGWRALPEVAGAGEAAAKATAARRVVTQVRAWGEPSLGCFLTVVDATSGKPVAVATVADELQRALTAVVGLADWQTIVGPGLSLEVTGAIVRGKLRGRVRGRLVPDPAGIAHAAVAACFYNEREPARCQEACGRLLASLEAPKVVP